MKSFLFFAVLAFIGRGAFANPECVCTDDDNDPVCGDDGVTYKSLCYATCRGTSVAHEGACFSGATEGYEHVERQKTEHLVEEVTESLDETHEGEQVVARSPEVAGPCPEGESLEAGHTESHVSDDSDSKSKDSEDDD